MTIAFSFKLKRQDFLLEASGAFAEGVVGIFGPSGSGKSSLLHLLAGIVKADAGHFQVGQVLMYDSEQGINIATAKRNIGIVFQDSRLFPHMTVEKNLRYGMGNPKESIAHILDMLELGPLLQKLPWQISGGQQQRVALGRALLSAPRLLLLDEPLAALDHQLKRQILPFLKRIKDETKLPMLYVSHDLSELRQMTDQLMVIEQGQVIGSGDFFDLVRQPKVLKLFDHMGLSNVFDMKVVQKSERGLTRLQFCENHCGPDWAGPETGQDLGEKVTLSLRAEDIALVKQQLEGISIRNQIPGTIDEIIHHEGKALCVINGPQKLLAELSPEAIGELELRPGTKVYCLFKAQALRFLHG